MINCYVTITVIFTVVLLLLSIGYYDLSLFIHDHLQHHHHLHGSHHHHLIIPTIITIFMVITTIIFIPKANQCWLVAAALDAIQAQKNAWLFISHHVFMVDPY